MNDQFIFFCTNIGNEKLLKEELRVFYPELKLSYSRKGFLTFKNTKIHYDINTISQLEVAFATRVGICLGKAKPENLLDEVTKQCSIVDVDFNKCIIHSFSVNCDFNLDAEEAFNREINEYSPINKTVIDVITLSDKEVWFGIHKVARKTTSYPNSSVEISLPKESPSKSYLKIAQTIELFNIIFDKKDNWLDFGSAPGGASFFLLERGCKVWGIDPAKMDDSVLDNPNFTHICKSVQDLSQEELPARDIEWVHVDLNLNPKQSIKEVLRLIKKYNFSIRGIIFTIQVIKMDHVKNVENFEDHFDEWGFTDISSHQIPTHKNEYVIIAKK
jgi:23S rRNA (cytidine2498-2'-O)-methyltransferase